jgi:hypothetical protein
MNEETKSSDCVTMVPPWFYDQMMADDAVSAMPALLDANNRRLGLLVQDPHAAVTGEG